MLLIFFILILCSCVLLICFVVYVTCTVVLVSAVNFFCFIYSELQTFGM